MRFRAARTQRGAGDVAAGILGLKVEEIKTDVDINATVGDLLNIATGNFKSNLCVAGLNCKLEPPKVSRSNNFFVDTVDGGGLERMAFKAGDLVLFVDITVNPWNE